MEARRGDTRQVEEVPGMLLVEMVGRARMGKKEKGRQREARMLALNIG